MSFSALDKIQMTSTSTGTSDLVLNAAETGTLANSYGNFTKLGYDQNVDLTYAIVHKTSNEWEVGSGSFRSFNGTATYALPNTTFVGTRHWGGVLAPNGEVHFAPYDDTRGMKLSATGVVSTYTLLYTSASLGGLYRGAVLASNGDVHFVPHQAQRGQKVSTSGTVSTYSLALTGFGGAYAGGVLAENGDIHFVPYLADRGQKVSSAGVVSTYSIVNTAGTYAEGAMVNGEVHFIPRTATVGQKINVRTGLVSTYTLAYTGGGLDYEGGVKHINGDIHFIPFRAPVGQKVNNAGTVSTYSLVYTASDAYAGGVLGRDGEIHLIPYNISSDVPIQVGQKISVAGVVSTYSLAFTFTSSPPYFSYTGGVLAQNGDIHFVPGFASRGQRINFSQNVLIRREVEESTNSSNSLVNFSSGTKNVFIGYPASLGQSVLPSGDNSEIGDSQAVLRLLQKRRARGSVFSNVTVSTYSLIISAATSWVGGVLAPNGDIHFIQENAIRGQKVNTLTGAVSTYSLVLTGQGGLVNFAGGVLSPSGDIYMIPFFNQNGRGQKINTNTGIVSTFTLIYTAGVAQFNGGVLDANGNVVFTPHSNIEGIGQRISSVGVVSTFSYIPTVNAVGRSGGVLAPNGDVYYLPNSNSDLLRIRADGLQITYSTPMNQVDAACLGVDGQIYAFARGSTTYMKLNPVTAIMSTFTKSFAGQHCGALLSGDGYIYLIPIGNSSYGERMSPTGIFSTYALPTSGSNFFRNGVIAPNGDIHVIPYNSTVGMKISTGCSVPLGEAISGIFSNSGTNFL